MSYKAWAYVPTGITEPLSYDFAKELDPPEKNDPYRFSSLRVTNGRNSHYPSARDLEAALDHDNIHRGADMPPLPMAGSRAFASRSARDMGYRSHTSYDPERASLGEGPGYNDSWKYRHSRGALELTSDAAKELLARRNDDPAVSRSFGLGSSLGLSMPRNLSYNPQYRSSQDGYPSDTQRERGGYSDRDRRRVSHSYDSDSDGMDRELDRRFQEATKDLGHHRRSVEQSMDGKRETRADTEGSNLTFLEEKY